MSIRWKAAIMVGSSRLDLHHSDKSVLVFSGVAGMGAFS